MRVVISCFLSILFSHIFSLGASGENSVSDNFQSKLLVYEPLLTDSAFLKTKDHELVIKLRSLFYKGDSVYLKGELDKACEFYKEGLAQSSKSSLKLHRIIFLNRLGFANYWLANISQSYNYYNQSGRIFKDIGYIPDTLAYIETVYFNKILSDKNEVSLDTCFESLIKNININNYKGPRLTKLFFLISNIYFNTGNNVEMKKDITFMKASLSQCKESREFWFFLERLTEINYYMRMGLVEIEGKYLMELYTQINSQPGFRKYQFEIKYLLARYYSVNNQSLKAIEILEEIKSFVDKSNHPYFCDYYLLLGYCYYLANDRMKPDILYKHVEKVLNDHKISDSRLAIVFMCRSLYSYSYDFKPEVALHYLKKSAEILDHLGKTYFKSYVDQKIGGFYYSQKNFAKAIEYYSFQLSDLNNLLTDSLYFISQVPRIILNQIPFILKYRGNSYYYLAEKKNFDKELLITAYEEKRKLLILWMKLFDYLEGYEDYRINTLLSIRGAYDEQIEFGYHLYEVTKDEVWLDKIFAVSQKSKAFMLKSFINDRMAQKISGIPEELVQKSLSLRKELDELQYSLNSSNLLANSQINNEFLMSTVMDKYSEYNVFIKRLEKRYPQYASLKNKVTTLSIKQIQERLDTNQALIEYQIGWAGLYIFYIDKEYFKTFFHPIVDDARDDLSKEILKYRYFILANPADNCSSDSLAKMIEQSKFLYKLLIEPIEKNIKNKQLIIIPDRELNAIPFETLIESNFKQNSKFPTKDISYLIYKNPISYLQSSSLLPGKMNSIIKNPKYVGFAPDYNTNIPAEKMNNRTFDVLPGALDELDAARKYFRGKIFYGKKATKQNFFSSLSKYDIIHLAMHTSIDENEPMNSELIFSNLLSDRDDQLKAYEVYSHENNIKMAVLSACNTGAGKVRAGEGIFNIARAFFLAGVQNVILTQWSISDKSSADLMKSFYKYLSKGNPTDIAMQKAKIDFLDKGDPVKMHPYYWSGYVTYGTYIFVPYKNSLYLLLIIPVLLIISSIIIIIRKFKI